MSSYSSVRRSDQEDTRSLIPRQFNNSEHSMFPENSRRGMGSEIDYSGIEMGSIPHLGPGIPVHRRRGRFEPLSFLRMFVGWPAVVICGQVIIQVFAWSFFGVVQSRGFIALPYSAASWAKDNPHLLTLLSTLISTALAAWSSFLFSFGVRHSVALYLRRPMSLSTFVSTVNISGRSLVLDPRKWKWSAMSMGVIVLTGVQTSGWSTFLTPGGIVIQTPVSGSELDLSSPALRQMYSSNPQMFRDCIDDGSLRPAFIVGGTESGYALSKHVMGSPASFTLMDQTFNVSTAGILPTPLRDVNASTWFPNMTVIPSTVQGLSALPEGLSSNYTMRQQGFSADVSCEFRNLTNTTTPSLSHRTDTVKDWNNLNFTGSSVGVVRYSEISSTCPVAPGLASDFTWAYTTKPNYVLALACGTAGNYSAFFSCRGSLPSTAVLALIFVWSGIYWMPPTVCNVSPKITKVDVDYSNLQTSSGTIDTTVVEGGVWDPDGPAGLAAVIAMTNTVFIAQAATNNIMGDEIKTLVTDVNDDNDTKTELEMTEAYVQGVAEYSGSVLRACLSGKNATFAEGVPPNMTIPTSGTIFTQTMGWTRHELSSVWVLIPGALVALATIIVVVVAVAQHAGDPPTDSFNPADPMHLVAVAAAGGLTHAFTGTSEKDIEAAEDMNVVLRSFPGRGPALVRALDTSA
ncbi:hypothetical protein FB451DRAFT_1566220 [Mycena latifolia]|nr:hypothetical protein FB451DRAFT_1566220 [Mycena latifolia]